MATQPTDKQYRGAKLLGISDYPVGATWIAKTDQGRIGTIELRNRGMCVEMWVWTTFYSDGSVNKSDWNPSYRLCRAEIPMWNTDGKRVRFRREK